MKLGTSNNHGYIDQGESIIQPIVLTSAGSRGDVLPFLLLGEALQDAVHPVHLVLPPSYMDMAKQANLGFTPLRADFDAMLSSDNAQNLKSSGRNPLVVMREGQRVMKDATRTIVEDIWAHTSHASAIIGHIGLSACTQAVSRERDIPCVHVTLQPYMPTRDFPNALLPLRLPLGGIYNRVTGHLVKRVTWNIFAGEMNRLSKEEHRETYTWKEYTAQLNETPILNAFSEAVIPFPSDWQANNHITGFWLPPPTKDWQAPEDLSAFLQENEDVIVISFGSVSDSVSLELVLEALQLSGKRAVIIGFDVTDAQLPENVFAVSYVPFEWLLKRVKAAVIHGGAGTIAQALAAQIPVLPVPHLLDQFFWSEQVFRIGAAVKPIANKDLTAMKLANAIHTLTSDTSLQEVASVIGATMQAEDGLQVAINIIQRHLSL